MISATISPKSSLNPWSRFTVLFLLLAFVGAALSLATAQTENILHRFNPTTTDGYAPQGGLVADAAGNLYGVTDFGGTYGCGILFELSPPLPGGGGWTETVRHEFANGIDGCNPIGGLTIDKNGNIYGTTVYGGVGSEGNSYGTAFELSPAAGGSWTYQVIASFDSGAVAVLPTSTLVIDAAGNLYGTSNGGNYDYINCGGSCGNIFELQPPTVSGGPWTGSSIYNFKGGTTDGFGGAGLVPGAHGVLYGTSGGGGTTGYGTFFRLTPPTQSGGAWTERILYEFTLEIPVPIGALAAGKKGTYFGTSLGPNGLGGVFQLSPPSAGQGWTVSLIYSFTGNGDGSSPFGVISDRSGNLYGETTVGGLQNNGSCRSNGCGAVYELTPPTVSGGSWTEITLHDFAGGSDGGNPVGSLSLLKGQLFGVTINGGTLNYGGGAAFRIQP